MKYKKKKLSEKKIDEIVISQVDDDSAWEEFIHYNKRIPSMISVNEIARKIGRLPKDKFITVCEFIDFIEHRVRQSEKNSEMSDYEVLVAVEKTGSFDFLHEPSEDIYTLNDGEPL